MNSPETLPKWMISDMQSLVLSRRYMLVAKYNITSLKEAKA
jgi:hypothetical protein